MRKYEYTFTIEMEYVCGLTLAGLVRSLVKKVTWGHIIGGGVSSAVGHLSVSEALFCTEIIS
jgi:hypothetical protein